MSVAGEERKRKILELLDISGKVNVKDLAKTLKVSTETVRRYLDELDKEEKLKKVYGGAIKVSFFNVEPTSIEREIINAEAKQRIGELAVTFINDNDVIVIDDGSTPLHLAKNIKNKRNLTIFTTSVTALSALIDLNFNNMFSGRIIILGGEINTSHHRVSGAMTLEMIENLFVDKYFISADGITLNEGITSYDYLKGMVSKKLIEKSSKTIVLIDGSKIGRRTNYKMGDFKDIDLIISNVAYPEEWEKTLIDNKVKWIVADTTE